MDNLKHVGILGLGHHVPEHRLTNKDLEKMVDTSDEWITVRTGIKERRIVKKGEKTSHLAYLAAKEALKEADLDPAKLDLIIVATSTPDHNFPSTACLVQKALKAPHAAAFDLSAACTGYLYAMTAANQFIQTGLYKNAVVIAAETMTSIIDWKDRNTCVLFGDGAGACVLGHVRGKKGILAEYLHSQGEFSELMTVIVDDGRHPSDPNLTKATLPYVKMQGPELFKIAVNSMSHAVRVAANRAGVELSDIKCIVPHQANDRIISAVAKKIQVPKEEFFINISHYGNMSAAAIAVALYEAVKEGKIKKGDLVAMVAFGAGLVSGANIIRW